MMRRPPRSTLFPYPRLFRSWMRTWMSERELKRAAVFLRVAEKAWTLVQEDGMEIAVERSEEHTSELQSLTNLVCRLLLEKKKKRKTNTHDFNHIDVWLAGSA